MRVQRCVRQLELAHRRADRTTTGEVQRETATSKRGSPRQAVTLTGPDGAADRADRSPVAELVLGEAQRVQRRDLGFGTALPAGEPKSALGERAGGGRVRLDQLEGGLRELERIVLANRDRHSRDMYQDARGAL